MDVNQVRFGSYSIGSSQSGAPRSTNKEASETQTPSVESQITSTVKADDMLGAMNIAGSYNMVSVVKSVNPADYIDDQRASEIEAMMAGFDAGVEAAVDIINADFPGMFTDQEMYALAAESVARGY